MRIFFVSFVLIFTLLYQAWGQHFLVKTKDNDKNYLIRTKYDHIEPIEGNEANKAEEKRPYWLVNGCRGKECSFRKGMWMWGDCTGLRKDAHPDFENPLRYIDWDEKSWKKCGKDCRHIKDSTGCAYSFDEKKCTAYIGRIIRTENKWNTMCIVFPEKIMKTTWKKDFVRTLENAKEKFNFIWKTDDPAYWCKVRSEEIWVFWCPRKWKKKSTKWKNKSCTIGKKNGIKNKKRRNEVKNFCKQRIEEKRESCDNPHSRFDIDITCDVVPDS